MGTSFVLGRVMDHVPPGTIWRTATLIVVLALWLTPIVLLVVGFSRYERWAHLRVHGRQERWARLGRLVHVPLIEKVLPHRVCEHRLLRTMNFNTDFLLAVPDWPVGTTIVINGPRRGHANRPRPIAVAFEPQELGGSMDALRSAMTEGPQHGEAGMTAEEAASLRSFGEPSRWDSARALVAVLLVPLVFGAFIIRDLYAGRRDLGMIFVAALLVAMALWPRLKGRNWWVVPGGLVFREHRPWSRKTSVGMVTAENGTLVINPGAGSGVVACGERAMVLNFSPRAGLCLLAAWISTAPRPTKEEILAFFGPDAVWEGT